MTHMFSGMSIKLYIILLIKLLFNNPEINEIYQKTPLKEQHCEVILVTCVL